MAHSALDVARAASTARSAGSGEGTSRKTTLLVDVGGYVDVYIKHQLQVEMVEGVLMGWRAAEGEAEGR